MNLAIVAGALLFAAQLAPATHEEILFVCNREGSDNICIINSTSLEIRQVTFEKEGDVLNRGPRWSPDRRRIAFFRRAAGRTDVHIMNSDGTGVTRVTNSDGSTLYRNPAWSPDGTRLAIECGMPNAWQICVVSIDGSGLRRLTDAGPTAASSERPDWSPDRRRIAFHSNRDAAPSGTPPFRGSEIHVMDADGSNVRRLTVTAPGRTTQNPAWSRDGQRLAFDSTRDGESILTDWEIYLMDADGTSIRRLTNDRKPDGHPRWSPDGRHLVFHSTQDGTSRTAVDVELYVIDADGRDLRRLTGNRLYDGLADW
jgi:TolB protein